jgi:hypothetical protein
MSFKSPLPCDLEHAMTPFRVNQNWYEEHWLRDSDDLTNSQIHRRADGSIDIDFYRRCAGRERNLAMKQACIALLAKLVDFFRLANRTSNIVRKAPFEPQA